MLSRAMMMLAFAIGLAPDASAAGPRHPRWPTEIDRAAAPLARATAAPDHDRVAALQTLETYATDSIAHHVAAAIEDPAADVRRQALRICFEREMPACRAPAAALAKADGETSLRLAALKVVALDPIPEHVDLLLLALRDSAETVRAIAAQILGWSPASGNERSRVRDALTAKLGDGSALVRQHVVASLGSVGDESSTLPMARLLEDAEPAVRLATAQALGQLGDARAVPALLRAHESPNEPQVARAILSALALLRDHDVADALLSALDDPPPGVNEVDVAEAIGLRPAPERALVDGLVARLREESLRRACLRALLLAGEAAAPALRAAIEGGLSPDLHVEVTRLMRALEPPAPTKQREPWPRPADRDAWLRLLSRGDASERRAAAAALGERAPAWLDRAIVDSLYAPDAPLVLAIATSSRRLDPPRELPWATLLGWAHDDRRGANDRCLAALAIAAADERRRRRHLLAELGGLRESDDADVRACVVLALARVGAGADDLSQSLVDEDARVRTAAALALHARREPRLDAHTSARLRWLAVADPAPQVRRACALALRRGRRSGAIAHLDAESVAPRWVDPDGFVEIEHAGDRLWVPAVAAGGRRWAIVPGLAGAHVVED